MALIVACLFEPATRSLSRDVLRFVKGTGRSSDFPTSELPGHGKQLIIRPHVKDVRRAQLRELLTRVGASKWWNAKARATWILERRAPREAGFTEQRKPPAPGSGRITGRCHTAPPWLNGLINEESTKLSLPEFNPCFINDENGCSLDMISKLLMNYELKIHDTTFFINIFYMKCDQIIDLLNKWIGSD
ncbi:hypothetical protein BT93_J1371 [Corymbia citriodora subsp. variegata]|nr:hypothetical protein BT93_J1371 [Corymbia citriodora subsp. variegata]